MNGSTAVLLARLAEQSTRARRVRLRETISLALDDFRSALKPVLDAFESRAVSGTLTPESYQPVVVRREKAPFLSGCESRPATVVPAGSSRSGRWR